MLWVRRAPTILLGRGDVRGSVDLLLQVEDGCVVDVDLQGGHALWMAESYGGHGESSLLGGRRQLEDDTIVCSEKGIELLEKSLRASPG